MATGFRRKSLDSTRILNAEGVAAKAPIIGDPRLAAAAPGELPRFQQPPHLAGDDASSVASETPSQVYEVGRIYEIPVGAIKSNPVNPRTIYTNAALDEMATKLTAKGQNMTVLAYVDEAGQVTLIEGETRLRSARLADIPTLRVEIKERPENLRALYEQARSANVDRNDQTPLDDAFKWKELLDKNIYTSQVDIAKSLGIGEDVVSRTLALKTLPRRVIDQVSQFPELLTLKMLTAIRNYYEIAGDHKTTELILEAAENGLGYREVVQRTKALQNGPVQRTRATKESISFRGGKGEISYFANTGKVELSLAGLSPEAAEELVSKIRGLFPHE